jgi:hypothetical protein
MTTGGGGGAICGAAFGPQADSVGTTARTLPAARNFRIFNGFTSLIPPSETFFLAVGSSKENARRGECRAGHDYFNRF